MGHADPVHTAPAPDQSCTWDGHSQPPVQRCSGAGRIGIRRVSARELAFLESEICRHPTQSLARFTKPLRTTSIRGDCRPNRADPTRACVGPRASGGADCRSTMEEARAGAALSAAHLWNDTATRRGACDLLTRLLAGGGKGVWKGASEVFRTVDKLTPDPATVALLEVFAKSDIDREAIGWHTERLIKSLGTLLPHEGELVGRVAKNLVAAAKRKLAKDATRPWYSGSELVDPGRHSASHGAGNTRDRHRTDRGPDGNRRAGSAPDAQRTRQSISHGAYDAKAKTGPSRPIGTA